jgi:hypothetical protein
MFGNTGKRNFSFTTLKSVKIDKKVPIEQRMKLSSLSSEENRPYKKRMVYFIVLLLIITGFMLYHGFRMPAAGDIRIEENEIEKVNGQ